MNISDNQIREILEDIMVEIVTRDALIESIKYRALLDKLRNTRNRETEAALMRDLKSVFDNSWNALGSEFQQ